MLWFFPQVEGNSVRLIRAGQAAKMLGVATDTLRRRDGGRTYLEIYDGRLKVHRMDIGPGAEGRFDADEIEHLLRRLKQAK